MIWGIDVARYELIAPSGWKALKDHGCAFVMIRGGYGISPDPIFDVHVNNVKNADLPFGVYRYMYAYLDPIEQAELLLKDAQKSGAACVCPDFENYEYPTRQIIPAEIINDNFYRIFNHLRAANVKLVTYTAKWFVSGYAPAMTQWLGDEFLWLSTYPNLQINSWVTLDNALTVVSQSNPIKITGVDRWDIWQFAGKAVINEVSSNDLDLNVIKTNAFNYLFEEDGVTNPGDTPVELPTRNTSLLPVPYFSQLGVGADEHRGDCGAAAALMVLKAYKPSVLLTVDAVYNKINPGADRYLSVTEMAGFLDGYGIPTTWLVNLTLPHLWNALHERKPVIALIHYGTIRDNGLSEKQDFTGPHFAVAIGMDISNIFIHDAYRTDGQSALAWPLAVFEEAWKKVGQIPSVPNPSFGGLIPVNGLGSPGTPSVYQAKVIANALTVRTGPGTEYPAKAWLKYGDIVTVYEEANGWSKIGNGYVSSKWIQQI